MLNTADSKIKPFIIPVLIIIAAMSRLWPHPWNATPIAAMALFGGYAIRNRTMSLLLPLIALFLGDILLQVKDHTGFYGVEQFYVYGSFILTNLMGRYMRPNGAPKLLTLSLAGSILFFLVTNFGTWLAYPQTYAHTGSGLTLCYTMGIPYFKGTLVGDLIYNGIFFAAYSFIPGLKYTGTTPSKV